MENRALQQIVDTGPVGAPTIRARVEQALTRARGPLLQSVEGKPGSVLVTFVHSGTTNRPVLSCALVAGREQRCAMDLVSGTTDVWWAEVTAQADTCVSYHFESGSTAASLPSGSPLNDPEQFVTLSGDRYAASRADRFNPSRSFPMSYLTAHAGAAEPPPPPLDRWDSVLELPGAEPYAWHAEPMHRGKSHHHVVWSIALRNSRTVTVWSPPEGISIDQQYPIVVLLDGEAFRLGMHATRIFDNLVGAGHVRPFVAVLVDNANPVSRMSEYACDPALGAFLTEELLPQLRSVYRLTDAPTDTAIGGFSLGGLAANWLGLTRSETFGNVISMSAALWWSNNRDRDQGPEWLTRQYLAEPSRSLKFWIDVGSLETAPLPFANGLSMVNLSRRFRATLLDKGYDVAGYREQPGGHDYANWRRTLPLALMSLFGTGRSRTHHAASDHGPSAGLEE